MAGIIDNATDSSKVAVGTEAQRPTGSSGYVRYNSDIDIVEAWSADNSSWVAIGKMEGKPNGSSADQAAVSAQYLIDESLQSNNGYYWITGEESHDPRQYYCDISGNEAGAGYMRIDSAWASYYGGNACNSGYGTLSSNGIINASSNSGGGGSGAHGGCGATVTTPFYARYFKVTNVSFTPNGNWGGVPFPNPTFKVITAGNLSGGYGSYYYPGWDPEGSGISYGVSVTANGGLSEGDTFDLGSYAADRRVHFGVGAYSGGLNRPCEMKIWFK
jgi:hypothetical protein